MKQVIALSACNFSCLHPSSILTQLGEKRIAIASCRKQYYQEGKRNKEIIQKESMSRLFSFVETLYNIFMLNRPCWKLYKTASFAHRNLDVDNIPKLQKGLLQLVFGDIWVQVADKNLWCIKIVRSRDYNKTHLHLNMSSLTHSSIVCIIICWKSGCCRCSISLVWIYSCQKAWNVLALGLISTYMKMDRAEKKSIKPIHHHLTWKYCLKRQKKLTAMINFGFTQNFETYTLTSACIKVASIKTSH